MKKLILFITIIAFALTVSAQDVTRSIGRNASNVSYTGIASDTITNTDSWDFQLNLSAKDKLQGYNLYVALDSVSGTPADAAVLAGSQDNSTFTTISTISWYGTSADTILIFNDVSTGILYKHLRLRITGTGTQKAIVNAINGKIGDL